MGLDYFFFLTENLLVTLRSSAALAALPLARQSIPSTADNVACVIFLAMPKNQWWSRTGSNRRPEACKATALPTELRPHDFCRAKIYWPAALCLQSARGHRLITNLIMVGLGRFELPTSRLSGVRSNQLSYRPMIFAKQNIYRPATLSSESVRGLILAP